MRPSDGFVSWVLSAITPDGAPSQRRRRLSADFDGQGDERARRNLLAHGDGPVLDWRGI